MFSHVFPLHKIFHLWDKLLLGDASYPLFVGYGILQQMRETLLSSGFNECILLFSDLPDVDIERCLKVSGKLYEETPKSVTYRSYQDDDGDGGRCSDEILRMLQREFNPRVSGADLVSALKKGKNGESTVLVVDVREKERYVSGAVIGSINVPESSISFDKKLCSGGMSDSSSPERSVLMNNKGKIIAVIGESSEAAAKVSEYFTKEEFPKVCSLDGGIDALTDSGLIGPVLL